MLLYKLFLPLLLQWRYTIAPNYTYISQNIIEAYKVYNNSSIIFDNSSAFPTYLDSILPIYLDSIEDRYWHIELTLLFRDCPPGLLPSNISCHVGNHSTCTSRQCKQENNYREFVRCNSLSNASLANGYWMGPLCDNCSSLVVAACPPGYCKTGNEEFLPLPSTHLDDHICRPKNRTGRLCGKYVKDYGPALNSDTYRCVLCNISQKILMEHVIYYILSVYLPLCVLTVVIILFSIKLTTGPANAFILYSQVISSTFVIYADERIPLGAFTKHPRAFENAYKFLYGLFNLEFFERFVPPEDLCFGTNLNTLDVILLDYIVAFFSLAMIL